MKKFLAILCVFATLFALASCKGKELTEEERLASLHASQQANREKESREVAASIKQENDIIADKQDTLNGLGKTEKNKKIVFLSSDHQVGMKECYEIILFDGNGKYKSWTRYTYYPTTEAFDRAVSDMKTEKNFAYESSDSSLRLIIHRYTNDKYLANETYDAMYQRVKDFGYSIVE